jgi:hypothetical protein
MIIGPAAKRPVILALTLADREVIYAGDAAAHKAIRIELPVLVAITRNSRREANISFAAFWTGPTSR